jgi:hypothetical protein
MARSHHRSQTVARVFYQRDPEGCLNKVPSSSEATLRSSHDDQEAQALLLGPYGPSRMRSAIGARPSKQRSVLQALLLSPLLVN